jgi:type II secretory pathway predicted ATPase ExeA
MKALKETHEHPTGISLLQGPKLSGKSTLIRSFIESLDPECAVALVDGKGLNTTNLLLSTLRQFGYDIDLCSPNELFGLLRVFALQQSVSTEPPLLIIENTHELNPSALRSLCELAELRSRFGSALKIILVSDDSLVTSMREPAMKSIAKRLLHNFHLSPMTHGEVQNYVHEKLVAAGADMPAIIFPRAVCDELWEASGGWPGILDRIALLALAKAESLPVDRHKVEHPALPRGTWEALADDIGIAEIPSRLPQLVVTNAGTLIQKLSIDKACLLIGRSEHNDISIDSRYISRHHALIVRDGRSTFLMDLNSLNGTMVNARPVSNHVLLHDDVITVGHHKIKFSDPHATSRVELQAFDFADTATMKTLADMRGRPAEANTVLLPTASEDLSRLQT